MNPMTMLNDGVAALRAMTADGLNRWSGILRLTSATDAPGIMPVAGRRVASSVCAFGHERARIAGPLPPAGLPA